MINEYSISTIVPVFNEAQCLPHSLERIYEFLKSQFEDFEIVIVESGSTDGSSEVCDAFAKDKERVVVVHEGARNGFGSALKLGFGRATKDLVWAVSVDLPFPLDSINRAVPLFEEYDCVLSYRSADDRGLFRRSQSVVYNSLAKWLLGLKAKHVNSTFKVYKRPVIQALDFESPGWLIDTEIIYKLQQMGVDYAEIPVPLIDRTAGESSVRPTTAFRLLWELVTFAASS